MGARLQAMADEVVNGIRGPKGNAMSQLTEVVAMLAQAKMAAEEPTSEVAAMLGEGHNGTYQIVEATAHVSAALEEVAGMVQGALARIEQITDAETNLGIAYNSVGHAVAGGSI
jgi:hypothetical protein